MKPYTASLRNVKVGQRAACAVAALTCTTGIVGALLLCFDSASPDTWLVSTPELMASLERCDLQRSRTAQVQCKQRVLAMRLAPDPQFAQLSKH